MNSLSTWLPFGVLMASLAGSLHCVAMCGGFVSTLTQSKTELALYHFGRLLGYGGLGALLGYFGKSILSSSAVIEVRILSSLFLFFVFLILAIQLWRHSSLHFSFFQKVLAKPIFLVMRVQSRKLRAFSTGLFSALLPCGWLYTFLLGAIATESIQKGATYLIFFWLGTIPSLSGASLLMKKFFGPLTVKAPKISAAILLLLGCLTLALKTYPLLEHWRSHQEESSEEACPFHDS